MTNQAILQQAEEQELPVTANVRLLNGDFRIRVGTIAKLSPTHVTIYDIHKGYRTTPMNLVLSVQICEPERNIFGRVWNTLKEVVQ